MSIDLTLALTTLVFVGFVTWIGSVATMLVRDEVVFRRDNARDAWSASQRWEQRLRRRAAEEERRKREALQWETHRRAFDTARRHARDTERRNRAA